MKERTDFMIRYRWEEGVDRLQDDLLPGSLILNVGANFYDLQTHT